jgi:hypothetical protein
VCNTRPQTETPQTTSFVEVDELILKPERRGDPKPESVKTDAKQEAKRIFSGWMFAASPGLHGVEHPVYDVWLVDCKGGKETVAPPAEAAAPAAPPAEAEATAPSEGTSAKKRRSRRVEPTAPPPMENQPIGPVDQAAPAPVEPEAAPAPAEDPAASAGGRKRKKRRAEQPSPAAAPPPASNPLFPF